jgi:hypothetical protein
VLDAAADLAAGNPPLSLGTPSGTTTGPSSSPDPAQPDVAAGENALTPSQRAIAARWLARTVATLQSGTVLGLPYGDADVSALARHRPALVHRALDLSARQLAARKLLATPAVASPDGWLRNRALRLLDARTTVLVSDHGSSSATTQWLTGQGSSVLVTDARAADGGPAPSPPLDALALRQRILCDAALRALAGEHRPMLVAVPAAWDPGPNWRSARFFAGLAQSWLQLAAVAPSPADAAVHPRLAYPRRARRAEVPGANVASARRLVHSGDVLADALRTRNTVADRLAGAAFAGVSYGARPDQTIARAEVDALDRSVRGQMAGIQVTGTDFVTLSGLDGTLTVSMVNALSEPVRVGVAIRSSGDAVHIGAPRPVIVAAHQRTTLRLHAHSDTIGVHRVRLVPVTREGEPVGTPLDFTLRTSQVGRFVWVILIVAGALLVVMILRRVVLRIRSSQWRRS